jgi:hypothetical protein
MDNQALLGYRAKLLEKILRDSAAFCAACRLSGNPLNPVDEGGWSVHQIAAHVRDVEAQVYGARVRRTVAEDRPTFANFDADGWAASQYSAGEPLEKILGEFEASMRALAGWLQNLPVAAWSRLGRHEIYGEFTMQTWVERSLAHVTEHLETVKSRGNDES